MVPVIRIDDRYLAVSAHPGAAGGDAGMRYLFDDGFSFLKTPVGTTLEQAEAREREFRPVDLPHDWLIYDSQNLYEDGTGWYRKRFLWRESDEKRAFLTFDGVYMDSAVYINGQKAGEWKYGYSSFTLEITPYLRQGENTLYVSACFKSPNSRWYSGAGIYRDVYLRVTDAVCLAEDGVYVSTRQAGQDFLLRVETEILCGGATASPEASHRLYERNGQGQKGRQLALLPVSAEEAAAVWQAAGISPDGVRAAGSSTDLGGVNGSREADVRQVRFYRVAQPRLWDVDDPALYLLETVLCADGRETERQDTVVGFRSTVFSPTEGFLLNGRKLKLNGVCGHHDLGALGAAFNVSAMRRSFRILRDMGVNAFRTAHNMPARQVLELADEMGILVVCEAFDMWERPKTEYDYARFFPAWWERDVASWVRRDRNHPCVIMWSIGNEIYDTHADERGQTLTRLLTDEVRRHDPCRNAAVTIGSNFMPWENAQKCADIVKTAGYNYAEKHYRSHHEAHPDWIIYGSETSSIVQSRGVYHFPLREGILSEDDGQCSALGNSPSSWGARSMEDCVTVDRDTPFSMGQFVWSGFDYIGEPTPYHTKNSYFGQIDTAGFPKDSFYVWQAAWTDCDRAPMVHLFPYWDFNPGQMIDVRVCSNAPYVELFLNGRSLGRRKISNKPGSGREILADYRVPYEAGTIEAAAYDEDGRELARERRHSFGDSAALEILPENRQAQADGREILFLQIRALDREGHPVENACDRVFVEVEGPGRLVGMDNGDSTDGDSYKTTNRRLFNGKLLVMVQTGFVPGRITVKVHARGLAGAETVLTAVPASGVLPVGYPGGAPCGYTASEACTERPVVLGRREEIPVRMIRLMAEGGRTFGPDCREIRVRAEIFPPEAEDDRLRFRAVSGAGVPSHLVTLEQQGREAVMRAVGDGSFRLQCLSGSGTDHVRVISQLEFTVEGLGQAYLNPYGFIAGSQYTSVQGQAANGNERGVATDGEGRTVLTYSGLDFGRVGSDEITVPVFALTDEACPIQIWRGVPEEGGTLLADVVYHKPSIWNVYQPETWRLRERLRGIETLSFVVWRKLHLKGFSFTQKAWLKLQASEADAVYGDSYTVMPSTVEQIGNNVSLEFHEMDFGQEGAASLTIRGRCADRSNTIHVRFLDGCGESRQILEFARCGDWQERTFPLAPVRGMCRVTFVFLPGSRFDFDWFRFAKQAVSQQSDNDRGAKEGLS